MKSDAHLRFFRRMFKCTIGDYVNRGDMYTFEISSVINELLKSDLSEFHKVLNFCKIVVSLGIV